VHRRFAFGACLALGSIVSVAAAATEFPLRGVTIEKEIVVSASPEEAWNAFTGDISGWWDHHFSEKPAKLVIDRVPGGGFWEIFDDAGHGVKHAEVIFADPGNVLKMRGPLGFSGKAVDLVHTFTFAADPAGTKVHLTLHAAGQVDDEAVAALEAVWDHFLVARYKAHVDAGKHRR
jgi:uncharacterized protein YndB with AHSA1/START domain